MRKKTAITAWPQKRLCEVAEVVKGKKPDAFVAEASDTAVPYLEAAFLRGQSNPQYISLKDTDGLVLIDGTDTLILWDGANAGDIFRGQTGVVASTMARVRATTGQLLPDFLYFCVALYSARLRETAVGSTVPHVRGRVVDDLLIPLPPIPVQERIVQILQKADDIHRKRQEALELADAILPAMYRDVFGEPRGNPRNWKLDVLGTYLVDTRYGTSEKTSEYGKGDPVLRIPNVIRRTIDTTDLKYLRVSEKEKAKLILSHGDILVVRTNGNKDYVGRCAVFDLDKEFLFASYLIRLRVDSTKLNPHYVVAYLATSMGRQEIDTNSRTSAGQYNISVEGLKTIRIPVPPIEFQQKFVGQYEQWKLSKEKLEGSLREASDIFSCLLSRAFTGELTAEWGSANTEAIAASAALHERLPRLLLLAFLKEKVVRTSRKAAVMVTALMKYAFLSQMEGASRRRLYHFVPYHYGPFAKEVYGDLQQLQDEGLVTVDNNTDEDKTLITLTDPAKADAVLAELPEDVQEDVAAVLNAYGDMDHNTLLKNVYEKYPAYAKKSRLRRGRAAK